MKGFSVGVMAAVGRARPKVALTTPLETHHADLILDFFLSHDVIYLRFGVQWFLYVLSSEFREKS